GVDFFQQARCQTQAVVLEIRAEGVADPESVLFVLRYTTKQIGWYETISLQLVSTGCRQEPTDSAFQFGHAVELDGAGGALRQSQRQFVETKEPANFFDNILGYLNVGAPERRLHAYIFAGHIEAEFDVGEKFFDIGSC